MSKPPTYRSRTYTCLPADTPGFDSLAELALDMRWSWNHCADEVWKQLDPALWELTHNPWVVLQTVSREQLERALADPAFSQRVDSLVEAKRQAAASPAWFQQNHPQSPLTCVAYFSMEFMLSEALPIYSGGLGNVAGDQLKSASDLGVPVVAVGLLYQQGYFRQVIDRDGDAAGALPLQRPRTIADHALASTERRVAAAGDRAARLFGLAAGLGGAGGPREALSAGHQRRREFPRPSGNHQRALWRRAGIAPEAGDWCWASAAGGCCGRSACSRRSAISTKGTRPSPCWNARACFMAETGQPFEVALAATRAGNLFTTHTAVAAGFDRFPPALIEQYLGRYAQDKLGISLHDLLALGRQNPDDPSESFNMAYLAIRGSGAANGVSRLHGQVSRQHVRAAVSALAGGGGARGPRDQRRPRAELGSARRPMIYGWPLAERTAGCIRPRASPRTFAASPTQSSGKCAPPAASRWLNTHAQRLSQQMAFAGDPPEEIAAAKHLFDPDVLTLGFARRFATYKRPNLSAARTRPG